MTDPGTLATLGLAGQTVLVTGGASGIGRAISVAFGRCRANVSLTYLSSGEAARSAVAEIEAGGGEALSIEADLTREDVVADVIRQTRDHFGDIDVLVTNAGGLLARSRVDECSLDLWERSLAVNLTSTFLSCRAVLPRMRERRRGCVITVSSLAARDGGGAGSPHYAAAKGGVLAFTKALAKEVGPLGIRVNGIAPGLIATRFHDRFSTAEGRRATVARTPLSREGTPEDVAGVALFLASPCASFLTGETIEVNGGQGMF